MENSSKPNELVARKSLPIQLYKAIKYIFSQNISDCVLVGGTALSGFYAGHRRSDDIDLFVKNEDAFKQVCQAVKSMDKIGAVINKKAQSNQYYKAVVEYETHVFTVDIVIDENLFKVGSFHKLDNVVIANLTTILMMKCATLVSRCSEKDLYDLMWFFEYVDKIDISKIIELGKKVDGGFDAETVLYSISSSVLSETSCSFSLKKTMTAKKVFKLISKFKNTLEKEFDLYLSNNTKSDLKELLHQIKKLS